MAALTSVPIDPNGHALIDRGKQPLPDRRTYGTSYVDLEFAVDIKGFTIYVESGTLLLKAKTHSTATPNNPALTAVAKHYLDNAAAVDAGGGLVQLAAAYHGLVSGDVIAVAGTTNYNGTQTLTAGTTSSVLEFTDTYVVETIPATAYFTAVRAAQIPAGSALELGVAIQADTAIFRAAASAGTCVINIVAWR